MSAVLLSDMDIQKQNDCSCFNFRLKYSIALWKAHG